MIINHLHGKSFIEKLAPTIYKLENSMRESKEIINTNKEKELSNEIISNCIFQYEKNYIFN